MSEMKRNPQAGKAVSVCAVGGSAGGMAALRQLFSALRDDLGLAYVVIVHPLPDEPYAPAEGLARHTRMPVRTITDPARLAPNRIYVVPPDRELMVEDGEVATRPFGEPRGLRAPIDSAFRSIAGALGDGMGIVLSGGGSDGSVGVRAIKEAGGIVLVQSPAEAQHTGMPRSAIATGVADFVLPVRGIAEQAAAVARSKRAAPAIDSDEAAAALRRIAGRMHARTGHDVSGYDRATMTRRVLRRMQVTGLVDLHAYEALLRDSPHETQALFTDLLVPTTMFFRDPDAFGALARDAVPAIVEGRDAEVGVRGWVAGCATGEEAYSLAMLLLEEQERRFEEFPIQVFATDLDAVALEAAREGRYPRAIEAAVSEERLERFFVAGPTHYRVGPQLRGVVLFANHSVTRDPPFTRMDVVSCRNVLRAMGRPLAKQVLSRLHTALRPGGHLFLGAAESAELRPELFAPVDPAAQIYTARPRSVERAGQVVRMPVRTAAAPPGIAADPLRLEGASSPGRLHADLLQTSVPPSVLVDEERRVMHLSAAAGRFMQPSAGPLPTELPGLVRPELRRGLTNALHRALAENLPTLTHCVAVEIDGAPRHVALHVLPTPGPWALVLFLDGGAAPEAGEEALPDDRQDLMEHLERANERLVASRSEHEATIQDLRAANEELQSINEEHRSASEELEISKQELQSVNEELRAVGAELRSELSGASSARSDLRNLASATESGVLFLDPELRVRMVHAGGGGVPRHHGGGCGAGPSRTSRTDRSATRWRPRRGSCCGIWRSWRRRSRAGTGDGNSMRLRPYRTIEGPHRRCGGVARGTSPGGARPRPSWARARRAAARCSMRWRADTSFSRALPTHPRLPTSSSWRPAPRPGAWWDAPPRACPFGRPWAARAPRIGPRWRRSCARADGDAASCGPRRRGCRSRSPRPRPRTVGWRCSSKGRPSPRAASGSSPWVPACDGAGPRLKRLGAPGGRAVRRRRSGMGVGAGAGTRSIGAASIVSRRARISASSAGRPCRSIATNGIGIGGFGPFCRASTSLAGADSLDGRFAGCCGGDGFGSDGSFLVVGGGCRRDGGLGSVPGRGRAAAAAVDVHLQDRGVVDEPVDGGDGDGGVGEDAVPGAEGLVGGDGEAARLVAPRDELEEDGGLGLVLLGVGEVVEDDEVEAVELRQRAFEGEVSSGGLEALHEVCGAGVEDAVAGLDQGVAYGAEQMGLAGARVADPELPMAMRLAPASSQSPAASASIRFRGTFGRVLKSKVASVLPPGRRDSLRWRWMRRVSRSASSHSARAARKRAGGPALGVGLRGRSPASVGVKLGRRSAVSMVGRVWTSTSRAVSGAASRALTRRPPAERRSSPAR